jgi:hypothetical protein
VFYGNREQAKARRAHEQFEGSTLGALAQA